ncbi:tetratricopeptide repeat-containing sensor histidine kinase [Chitinophaga rhizophila]|uniref:histidine kinase n=1 Tax=Chitinophaga rhizophila TaxID=2866212 RepID=A0ABS7GJ18_9BACT|nr:histidine kinase dimerization/phosphoacceptor domain -containing protein [Chitinophaga rhizophila]MBW8687396.1 histidine kinase [Chitinophaga rhizophila]
MSGIRYILFITYLLFTFHGWATTYTYSSDQKAPTDIPAVQRLWELGDKLLNSPHPSPAAIDSVMLLGRQIVAQSRHLQYLQGTGLGSLLISRAHRHKGLNEEAKPFAREALRILRTAGTDAQKAEAFIELGNCYSNSEADLPEKIHLFEEGIAVWRQIGDTLKQASLLEFTGDLYHLKQDYRNSLDRLEKALVLYKSIGHKNLQGVYALIGAVHTDNSNFVEGLRYNLLAVETGEQLKDSSSLMASIYNRLAVAYYGIDYNKQAMEFYQKGLALSYKNNDAVSIQNFQINIGELLIRMKQYKQGLDSLDAGVYTHPLTDIYDISYVTIRYLRTYLYLHDYKNAAIHYRKMLDIYNSGKINEQERSILSAYLSLYLVETGNYTAAIPYLDKLAVHQTPFLITNSMVAHLRFRTDSALGNLSAAIKDFQVYKGLADSLTNLAQARQLGQLQLQFETDQKDKDIRLLVQKSQLQEASLQKERVIRYFIIGGVVGLIIFLGLVYARYRSNKRTNIQLESQQGEINTRNETLKGLLEEKEWLLKEIHHRVKNNLQIIISLLNTQSQYLNNKDALAAIRNSQQRMYSMSLIHQRLYQTENLGKIDMYWYIPEMIGYIKDSLEADQRISFFMECDDIELDVVEAVPIGLILNEAVSNALKYAFPGGRKGSIQIRFQSHPAGMCQLSVADNGVGIPPGKDILASASLGMSLMQGLSQQLDGDFELTDNQPGVSVKVTFRCREFISNEQTDTLT